MRIVPVLFPSDLGRSREGIYEESGQRGAPDIMLDLLEGEGVRLSRPVSVPVGVPEGPREGDLISFDAELSRATTELANVVAEINAEANFPLVLGGDGTALLGHALGHSQRHPQGIGLALLADAYLDTEVPQTEAAKAPGWGSHMALSGVLKKLPEETELGRVMKESSVQAKHLTVAGVRAASPKAIQAAEKQDKLDVWTMERLELDGESEYRSALTRDLSYGPILLSIDASGLDPDLMPAVGEPAPDGLDWSFLKRSLEQCLPHRDRILGLDICEVDPTREDAHQRGLLRLAETLAPFLRRLR